MSEIPAYVKPPLSVVSKEEGVTATLTVRGATERHTGTLVTFDNGSAQFVWQDPRGVTGYLAAPASDIKLEKEGQQQ